MYIPGDSEFEELSLSILAKEHEDFKESNASSDSFFQQLEAPALQATPKIKPNLKLTRAVKAALHDSSNILPQKNEANKLSIIESMQVEETLATGRAKAGNELSNLGLSNRLYCKTCKADTISDVSYEYSKENWWHSMASAVKNWHCCRDNKASECILVHRCKTCGSELAKVYTACTKPELNIKDRYPY